MKYMLLKDYNLMKDKLLKYFVLQCIILLFLLFLNSKSIQYFSEKDLGYFLGINNLANCFSLDMIYKILSYIIIIYINLKLILYNLFQSTEFVNLRIDSKKYIFNEMINISMFIIVMRIILFIIVFALFLIFNTKISILLFFRILIKDILFYLLLSLLVVTIVSLFSKSKKFALITFSIVLLYISTLFLDIIDLSAIILFILVIVTFVINVLLFKLSLSYNFLEKYINK